MKHHGFCMFFCMDLWFRTWSHHWVFYRNPRKARGKTVIWQSRTLPSLLRELPTRSYYFSASFPHCQTILVDLSLYKWKENDCSFSKNYDLGTNTKNEKKIKMHTQKYMTCAWKITTRTECMPCMTEAQILIFIPLLSINRKNTSNAELRLSWV